MKKNLMPSILAQKEAAPGLNAAALGVPKPKDLRIGEERTTLKLLSYYISENIAKAMGQQLKDV